MVPIFVGTVVGEKMEELETTGLNLELFVVANMRFIQRLFRILKV